VVFSGGLRGAALIAGLLCATRASRAQARGDKACSEICPAPQPAGAPTAAGTAESAPFIKVWCGVPAEKRSCNKLASLLAAEIEGRLGQAPTSTKNPAADAQAASVAQPDRRTATNKSGGPAQTEPVESIQPITLAGGALSLAGTRTGTKGVATVTINPLALARSSSPLATRLLDVSVTAPFNLDGSSDDTRFVGIRLRANAAAPWSASVLENALTRFHKELGTFADSLEVVLRETDDVDGCVQKVLAQGRVEAQSCGKSLEDAQLKRLRSESYQALSHAQREADRYSFGLDVRLDLGDPTGDQIAGDKGTRIQGGLAGGMRVPQGEQWDIELRGHIGGDYFRADAMGTGVIDPVYAFDWGAAVLLSGHATRELAKQRMAFGIGVAGRHSGKGVASDLVPTNFLDLRLMTIVPTTDGADLGLAFTIPLDDSAIPRGSIISVSTDLGLLDGTSHASRGR
jgi:hypothetical protein